MCGLDWRGELGLVDELDEAGLDRVVVVAIGVTRIPSLVTAGPEFDLTMPALVASASLLYLTCPSGPNSTTGGSLK